MSDLLSKAARYRQWAEECLALATIARDDHIRHHYEQLAETYLSLAMAELSCRAQASSVAALKRAAQVTDIERMRSRILEGGHVADIGR